MDPFFFLYHLTFFVILLKKHADHLQPVHLFTLNALVDIVTCLFIYVIHDIFILFTGRVLQPAMMFGNVLFFCFSLDVIVQDLDGFLFVYLDAYYHEWITNRVSIAIIIIIKIFEIILVGSLYMYLGFQNVSNPGKIVKNFFFNIETLYFYAIPNIICLSIIAAIIIYINYTKYRLSLDVAPKHNIRLREDFKVLNCFLSHLVILFIFSPCKTINTQIFKKIKVSKNAYIWKFSYIW